ncbi:MAG: SUMF1/EgtB/PvdO family nonheme iron enzyme [Planctomycetia bacterium]|nr:SUMF1/EgtB/PvdO family nonheme iron enzyme [Planctomycetia bacterium]
MIGVGRATAAPVTFDWVTVGDIGNFSGDEITTGSGPKSYGAVAYEYQIGKYEVTNAQYVEFLNAKAASDPLSLYNASMSSNGSGGIIRSGVSGSFTYSVKPGHANKPVNYVSFYDAARFTNWINNGQGNADTESGAYTLLGGTATPTAGTLNGIARSPSATIVLPSVDEWYKAAFYDPTKPNAVDEPDYWKYPTQNDAVPSLITAQPSSAPNTANIYGTNFYGPGYGIGYAMTPGVGSPAVSTVDYLTDVGAYTGSASHYGTYDQAGNVIEWTETLTMLANPNGVRNVLGGNFANDEYSARYEGPAAATGGSGGIGSGFRLVNLAIEADAVPEPGTLALALTGLIGLGAVAVRKLSARRRQQSLAQVS